MLAPLDPGAVVFNSGKKDIDGKPCSTSAKNFHDLHIANHTKVQNCVDNEGG
jgi:hypothetical protein